MQLLSETSGQVRRFFKTLRAPEEERVRMNDKRTSQVFNEKAKPRYANPRKKRMRCIAKTYKLAWPTADWSPVQCLSDRLHSLPDHKAGRKVKLTAYLQHSWKGHVVVPNYPPSQPGRQTISYSIVFVAHSLEIKVVSELNRLITSRILQRAAELWCQTICPHRLDKPRPPSFPQHVSLGVKAAGVIVDCHPPHCVHQPLYLWRNSKYTTMADTINNHLPPYVFRRQKASKVSPSEHKRLPLPVADPTKGRPGRPPLKSLACV